MIDRRGERARRQLTMGWLSTVVGFLVALRQRRAHCDVTLRLRDGALHGQIDVRETYLESSLPQPDLDDAEAAEAVAQVLRGESPKQA